LEEAMAEITLREDMFVNNKYYIAFGANKGALFTIIDEEFQGNNRLGRINRLSCLVTTYDGEQNPISNTLSLLVIGIGDGVVGVMTDEPELLGKALTHENMEQCVVELSEA
jgi:hypothetical protein